MVNGYIDISTLLNDMARVGTNGSIPGIYNLALLTYNSNKPCVAKYDVENYSFSGYDSTVKTTSHFDCAKIRVEDNEAFDGAVAFRSTYQMFVVLNNDTFVITNF